MQNVEIWLVFDDMNMIVDVLSNKEINPLVTELMIRGRKLKISIFLLHNLIFLGQKILKKIVRTILSWNSE